jgi:acetyl-CoA C-acetyltransferase
MRVSSSTTLEEAMSWSGEVAIVGAYESPRRRAPGVHPFAIQAEVIAGALADAGLELADVNGFCTAAGFPPEGGMQMSICEVAEYVGLRPTWFDSTDVGGATFIVQAGHAALAIAAGLADVVVVSYAAAGYSWPGHYDDLNTNAAGPGQWEIPYGPSTVATYALAARRHMHEYGTTPEQLAAVAVQCRANAAANPDARFREPITVEDVLASPVIAEPLQRLDCCVVTDSGGAFVMTSRRRAEALERRPVYVLGMGEALGQMQMNQMPRFTETAAVRSGAAAFRTAGLRPEEIDCAQIYDSFTITVLLTLESLGFCGPGESGSFVEAGQIAPEGVLPINTDGGGLSSNHPGRRGVFTVIEGVRQLRGESPGVQLDGPRTCLVHGTGGSLSATATMILGV